MMKFIAENPFMFIIVASIIAMVVMMIFDLFLQKAVHSKEQLNAQNMLPDDTTKKKKSERRTPSVPYAELMKILDSTINQELYFWLQLSINMKDVKIIDFSESVETLSRKIMNALSEDFLEDLQYYHEEVWIMEFIVKRVKIYVTEYIKTHPVG